MNNKQKLYLGVFMIAVVVLGIMYSMGTFSKKMAKSIMAFDAAGMVEMRPDLMSTNAGNITTNTSGISTNTGNITTNTSGVATNTGNILTNTGNILTNTGGISTNTGNITTNTSGISTNTGNITTNTSGITTGEEDRTAIKNFVRSKAVLFNSGDYNSAGTATLARLLADQRLQVSPEEAARNDQVFIKSN